MQLELDDKAKELMTINTPYGLYRYNRMCFGVASSPAVFQRLMDAMTADLPGTAAYMDDLILTGSTPEEHWAHVDALLKRLSEYGLSIKAEKCKFYKPSVRYLGHVIDRNGKRPSDESTDAIRNLPVPQDKQQLISILGKINYYGSFIPNLSSVAAPLNAMRSKDVPFRWTPEWTEAFQKLKEKVIDATTLHHFNPSMKTVLATDASPYGIGAALSQIDASGKE